MTATAPQKFSFDTHFDDNGRVLSSAPAPRPKRAYSPIEVDMLRAEAFAQGQAAQRGADESLQAQSLAAIADACREALPTLERIIAAYRAQSADLALATGEAIASAALERCPQAPLAAALEALSAEMAGSARLIVRVAASSDAVAKAVQAAAAEAGLADRVVLRDDASLASAAFVIEWPDGRAEYDPEGAMTRVREALNAALSAEADGAIDLLNGEA